jgi:hypothetical protein
MVKFVIPQMSKLEIFNQKVSNEEPLLISYTFYSIEGQSRTKIKWTSRPPRHLPIRTS